MRRKTILRAILWSSFTAAMYFPSSIATTLHLYRHKDPDIEAYVQENLEQIIEQQEEKIGISYPAERPKIEYLFPEEEIYSGFVGLYDNKEDTIYLPSGLLTTPEWDFGDFMATIFTFNSTADVKRVLDHELTHFYCDGIKEQVLGQNYHIFEVNYFIPEERIANQLINEGIAKYVENKMNGEDNDPFPFEEWPTEIKGFSNRVIYEGGYALVRPIIDKHGEKGIQFLLFNHLTPKELYTPEEYQEKILTDIAKLQ